MVDLNWLLGTGQISAIAILTQFALVLVIGIAMRLISQKTGVPFVVLLILAGTVFASVAILDIKVLEPLPELIRVLALIIVVFSAGFRIKLKAVEAESNAILRLSTIGLLLTVAIITLATYYLLDLPLISAAFLGALLGGTSPAAISSVLKKTPGKLQTVLVSESIFNQPFSIILPLILLDWITKPEAVFWNVPKFFLLIIVGGVVGLVGFYLGQKILNYAKREHEEIVGLMIALAVYALAENFYGSGILAVAITSILLTSSKLPAKRWLGKFNEQLAFLFTIFVFIFLGMQFPAQKLAALSITRYEIIVIAVALLVARLFSAMVVLYKSSFSFKERIKIGLIAPKGIAPAALAPLLIAAGIAGAFVIGKIVYIAIIVSVLISLMVWQISTEVPKSIKQLAKEKTEKHEEAAEKGKPIEEAVKKS